MTRSNHAKASKGANGKCRDRRRQHGERRAWARPLRRANLAIIASVHCISRTLLAFGAAERSAEGRPVRTSRKMHEASAGLVEASQYLYWAARELAKTNAAIARDPANAAEVPQLLIEATAYWIYVSAWLEEAAGDVFNRHNELLRGLETGELVPEPSTDRPRRIAIAPRPAPIRAFLRRRQLRVVDRIASILRRRRRTPRPAAIRVPRRSILGRAPPFLSVCPL